MVHIPIRSRRANLFLAVVGGAYVVIAPYLLIWFTIDIGTAATAADRTVQAMLLFVVAVGVFLLMVSLRNLGHLRRFYRPASRASS